MGNERAATLNIGVNRIAVETLRAITRHAQVKSGPRRREERFTLLPSRGQSNRASYAGRRSARSKPKQPRRGRKPPASAHRACCGKQVSRYTYTVTNYPGRSQGVQANLYVCEGQPVAGDILCAGADGFQDTLVYPEVK